MSEHRLIYADELYDTLANKLTWLMNYGDDVYLEVGKDIREVISDQPTAYDIDEVMEHLEEKSIVYCREYGYAENENVLYLPDAIEIVERGGAE